jgi:hypothetical protein
MKTVDSNFTDERDKQHPAKVKHKITLQAYDMSGNAITDEKHDLTNDLIYLPEIKSELEDQLNANKASSLSLEFYDNEDTIWDYFASGNRRWSIKVEQTYDTPVITDADDISTGDQPLYNKFSPNGNYVFIGHHGTDFKLQKFSVSDDGALALDSSINTAEKFYEMYITDDYIYAAKDNGWFRIYDYDLTLIGSVDCGTNELNYVIVSDDENHAWASSFYGTIVYYLDISTKTAPTKVTAVSSISATGLAYWDDKLYVSDYTNKALKTYNASTPPNVPYSLLDTLSLGDNTPQGIDLDTNRSILYIPGIELMSIVDIADTDDPVLATTFDKNPNDLTTASCRLFRNGKFLFTPLFDSDSNKYYIEVIDSRNYYKSELYSDDYYKSSIIVGKGSTYNNDNVIVFCDQGDDKIYSVTIWQNWITLFEGIIDYQSLRKIGRNRTYFTAYTGEKELETYNAEMVYDDSTDTYLRNITGVTVSNLTGGTTGAKKLEYTYKTINEDTNTIDEFGLKYEGGEEFLFREAGIYDLTGSSGQIITLTISNTNNLPRKNAEDTLIVGDTEDHTKIGYWYESEEIDTIIGYLWDKSDFTISNQNTDIDTSVSAITDTLQFCYCNKASITNGEDFSCIEDNPPDSDNILCALGTDVFNVAYNSSSLKFTGDLILNITDTFASATRVDKILRLQNGNALVVCVAGTKEAGANGWCSLQGVMEIENDGTIDDTWNEAFLKDLGSGNTATSIAGTSVELINYTKDTGEVENRNGFYWVQYWLHDVLGTSYRTFYVSFVDIDDDPSSIAETTPIYNALTATDCWVAPNIVYHRYWNGSPTGGDVHCWFLMANNIGGYIERVETGSGDVEEALTYCTETTINTIRAIRVDDSQNRFYLITDKMASDKQYVFKCIAAGTGSTSINTDPVDYILDYAAYLPNIYRAIAFEIDGADNAQNLVMLNWGVGTNNPTVTTLISGFMGHTYTPHPVCYLDDDETYAGISEMGALSVSRFFIGTNLSTFIVPVADFTDLNVRQALNMMAEAYVCLWNRPELDTANFISRGNIVDTYTLTKTLYVPQYQITKQPPYLAIEAKNTYYEGRVYLARHPDNYMGEKGDILQIDNRFITPINKEVVAKVYYDFYNTIRRIFEVETYYLIELELFDKVVMTLYDIDGNVDETVNTLLVEKSFNNATKSVRLRLVELDVSAFSSTIGFMTVGGGFVC